MLAAVLPFVCTYVLVCMCVCMCVCVILSTYVTKNFLKDGCSPLCSLLVSDEAIPNIYFHMALLFDCASFLLWAFYLFAEAVV